MPAWAAPDPAARPARQLRGGVPLQVVEEQSGWARVVQTHGRTWWVDGRQLEPLAFSGRRSNPVVDLLASPGKEMLALVAVVAVTVLSALVLAPVLALPGNLLKSLIPVGDCTAYTPGTGAMYLCSTRVGFLTTLGPLLVLVVGIFLRKPIMAGIGKVTAKLPRGSSTLVMPLVSTLVFSMVYASVHSETMAGNGLVPNRIFPAVLGVLTFLAARLQRTVASRFGRAITVRNKIPGVVRGVLALALPLAVSYVITDQDRVTDVSTKEQVVSLLTVVSSYAAFVPRDGDFFGAAQRLLLGRGARRLRQAGAGGAPR